MRLYSRGQVVFFSLASAIGVLAVAVIFGFVSLPKSAVLTTPKASPVQAAGGDRNAGNIQLQTNPAPSREVLPVDSNTKYSENELANIEIYQQLNAAVVNITTETVGLNWFLEPVPQGGGIGSGSIIDNRGYVLTNYHVVEKAYKVTITLANGAQFPGKTTLPSSSSTPAMSGW